MTRHHTALAVPPLLLTLALVACGGVEPDAPGPVAWQHRAFTSPKAMLANMTFDGEAVVDCGSVVPQIQNQLLFTVGHLNQVNSVGRIDSLQISDVKTQPQGNGTCLATYRATMPVGWAKYVAYVPKTYTMRLPRDATWAGLNAFFATYAKTCQDWMGNAVVGNLWYYYRPDGPNCKLADKDIVTITASMTVAAEDGSGTYPELHKIWEDGELNALVIFGMYGEGHTPSLDPLVTIYGLFNNRLKVTGMGGAALTPTPADVASVPGLDQPRVTWRGTLADGRRITIHTLMIKSPTSYDPAFDQTFQQLSPDADIIIYNGHSGFGANIRALAKKARFKPGHYTIVSMMGCDTFAYIDDEMSKRVAAINPDDPAGTKYLDMITNLTPGKPGWLHDAALELLRGVADPSHPWTYDQILFNFDQAHIAAVTGDEDNVYLPGTPIAPVTPAPGSGSGPGWAGLEQTGTVARDEEVHVATSTALPVGSYAFSLTGTGDADLYVRIGAAPTLSSYDCRPYRYGSSESCVITLSQAATVHVMVRGWAPSSDFVLTGAEQSKADAVGLPNGPARDDTVGCSMGEAGKPEAPLSLLLALVLGLKLRRRR